MSITPLVVPIVSLLTRTAPVSRVAPCVLGTVPVRMMHGGSRGPMVHSHRMNAQVMNFGRKKSASKQDRIKEKIREQHKETAERIMDSPRSNVVFSLQPTADGVGEQLHITKFTDKKQNNNEAAAQQITEDLQLPTNRPGNVPMEQGGRKIKKRLDVEGKSHPHRAPLPDDVKAERHPYHPKGEDEHEAVHRSAVTDPDQLQRTEEAMEHSTIGSHTVKRSRKKPANLGYEEPRHHITAEELQRIEMADLQDDTHTSGTK